MKSVVAALLIPVFLISLLAHHSVTREFDHTRSTDIQGVITKVDWMNPHSRITFEAKGANGMRTRWRVQIAAAALYLGMEFATKILSLQNPSRWKSGQRAMDQKPPTDGSGLTSTAKVSTSTIGSLTQCRSSNPPNEITLPS